MLKREDIRIRDPFIFTDKENGCYYMYGTTALKDGGTGEVNTFSVYKTEDLENFSEPKVIFDGSAAGFWGTRSFWAAEMHAYNGKYYLFASCIADGKQRATCIFVSDMPDGTFVPVSDEARTPNDWGCLDGTLFVEDGVPYMVFCREWTKIGNGEIYAMAFSDDLSHPVGEPVLLFRASDDPDVDAYKPNCYVTDGPFLYREGGKIKMIWSSFKNGKYAVFEAESERVEGPWIHNGSRFDFDAGHAMLFETLDGTRMISMHSPNKAVLERAIFMKY